MTINKTLLTGAFEKIGPDAVERGLRDHGAPKSADIWERCFLAHAYGPFGALKSALARSGWRNDCGVMGLTADEFLAVWQTVDFQGDAFFALANEWLENRPASIRAVSRETAGVGECRFGRGE